jgi:hypothetical protein
MPYLGCEGHLARRRLWDVWDVRKRPTTRLERPVLPGLLTPMRLRGAVAELGCLGASGTSEDAPRRGLEVPTIAVVIERDVT